MIATLAGYCDPFCVRTAQEVSFMLHTETEGDVGIDVVRIAPGDRQSEQGLILQPVTNALTGKYPCGPQPIACGSYVFFETEAGGAVFSTGSIAWAGALGATHYKNDTARLSTNALRRFSDPAPFVRPTMGDKK